MSVASPASALALISLFTGQPTDPETSSHSFLSGGHSGATLVRFEHDGTEYVARQFSNETRSIIRSHNAMISTIAGEQGLGPKVVYVDPELSGFVMDFVPGEPCTKESLLAEEHLEKFGRFVREIHRTPGEHPDSANPFNVFLRRLVVALDEQAQFPSLMKEARQQLAEIDATLKLWPEPSTLIHNDLNGLNILQVDDQFQLIDWECAGRGDPYLDLAMVIRYYDLNEEESQRFLTAYFGAPPTQYQRDRVLLLEPVPLLIRAGVFLAHPISEKSREEFDRIIAQENIPNIGQLFEEHSQRKPLPSRETIGLSFLLSGLKITNSPAFKAMQVRLQTRKI